MRPIQVKQLDHDVTPTAVLALVDHLKTLAPVFAEVDAALPVRTGVASSDIVRSYLGQLVQGMSEVPAMIGRLLVRSAPDYGVLPCGWLPLGIDTFAMDNCGTSKQGVGRTYVGVDGYCQLAAYLGSHGFCLELSLRPGVQQSA
jgi:hypothetical protein